MDIKSSHRTSYLAFCVTAKKTAIQLTLPPKKQLYSSHSLSHGPVALYSYTARAYTAGLYRIQYTAYTLYSPIRRPSGPPAALANRPDLLVARRAVVSAPVNTYVRVVRCVLVSSVDARAVRWGTDIGNS